MGKLLTNICSATRALTLSAVLALALSASSPAQPLEGTEADRFSRIRMDGAPITRDYKLPVSLLEPYIQPGALVTCDGVVMRYKNGILSARWELIEMLEIDHGVLTLSLGNTLYEDVDIPLCRLQDGGPEQPFVKDPETFTAALIATGGFVRAPDRPGGEVYVRLGPAKKAEPTFFPYSGWAKWRRGWTLHELASLPAQSGLTVNDLGIALVTPFAIESMRWDEGDQLTVPFDKRQRADLEVYDLDSASSLNVSFPAELYLPPQDVWKVSAELREGFDNGHFQPAGRSSFYPLRTTCPEYVAAGTPMDNEDRQPIEGPFGQLDMWPDEVREAGLYVQPDGIWQVQSYTVTRIPFASFDQLYGDLDGGFEVFPTAVTAEPALLGDGVAYRQLRRDILKATGMRGDGTSGSFEKPEEGEGAPVSPHYYSLDPKLAWKGLPLAILGDTEWPRGLYILPEGIVSVTDSWIGLAPWSEVRSLTVEDDEEEGGSIFESIQGDPITYTSFPPTRYEEAPRLALKAGEALAVIERYVTFDNQGVPHPRPAAEMPVEKTRLEWRALSTP